MTYTFKTAKGADVKVDVDLYYITDLEVNGIARNGAYIHGTKNDEIIFKVSEKQRGTIPIPHNTKLYKDLMDLEAKKNKLAKKARDYDNLYNEGCEGYNPYR